MTRRRLIRSASVMLAYCCAAALLASSLTSCTNNPLGASDDVAITGLGSALAVGEQAQLHATDMSGHTDVTKRVRWSTTSLTCLVNLDGLLTARGTGECTVTAAYGTASTTATTQIGAARTFTIRGTVSDFWATGQPVIAGATVTIASGAQAGRSAQTDATGAFTLASVPNETVDLRAEAPGLEAKIGQASPESSTIDFALLPLMTTVVWNRMTMPAPSASGVFPVPFDTHHRGPFTITLVGLSGDCGTYDLLIARIAPLSTTYSPCQGNPLYTSTSRGTLEAGHYELEVYFFSMPPGPRSIELVVPR